MTSDSIHVVVTGPAWMGGGIGSVGSALERLFDEAEHEIMLSAYRVGNAADLLLERLESALARGVLTKMVVNCLPEQPRDVRLRLGRLASSCQHFMLYDFPGRDGVDLHAKVIVSDRRLALVGSSNLSTRGLLTNYEMAVLMEGAPAGEVARTLDRLFMSPELVEAPRYPQLHD